MRPKGSVIYNDSSKGSLAIVLIAYKFIQSTFPQVDPSSTRYYGAAPGYSGIRFWSG